MPGEVPDTFETVRASDGATFQMRVFKQARDPMAPVLVCMPAMGTKAEFYVPFTSALFAAGFQVAVGELRGHGTSSVRARSGARYGFQDMIACDYPALFEAVERAFPRAPRFLLGHSLGGQLGMLYLSRNVEMAAGAILVAAPSCYYKGWPFRMPVLAIAIARDRLAPEGAIAHLRAKLRSADVDSWTYAPTRPSRLPHFGWVRDCGAIVARVRHFVDGLLAGAAARDR